MEKQGAERFFREQIIDAPDRLKEAFASGNLMTWSTYLRSVVAMPSHGRRQARRIQFKGPAPPPGIMSSEIGRQLRSSVSLLSRAPCMLGSRIRGIVLTLAS